MLHIVGRVIPCVLAVPIVLVAAAASAQSLKLERGQQGVEIVAGGSFGPSSDGVETRIGIGLDGRWDVGVAVNRYTYSFDGFESTFSEIAPFVRAFVVKQSSGGSPVSLALGAQVFIDRYDGDDSGGYVMAGPTVYKDLQVSETFSIQPHLGFSLVRESYTFDGITDSQVYFGRSLGLTLTTRVGNAGRSWLQLTMEEQAFRSETYRAARLGFVHRF